MPVVLRFCQAIFITILYFSERVILEVDEVHSYTQPIV